MQETIDCKIVWQRLKRNRLAILSLILIYLCSGFAFLAYLVLPDKTPYANKQSMELEVQAPGTSVMLLQVRKNSESTTQSIWEKLWGGSPSDYYERPIKDYRFKNDKIIFHPINAPSFQEDSLSLADVIFPLTPGKPDIHLIGNYVQFRDYYGHIQTARVDTLKQVALKNNLVSRTYWLGTDQYGRDLLSRFLLSTRISLSIGIISVLIALITGMLLGSFSGLVGGHFDLLISWLIRHKKYMPAFLLALIFSFILDQAFLSICIIIGLSMWAGTAHLFRTQTIKYNKEYQYRSDKSSFAIKYFNTLKAIWPKLKGPVVVIATTNFATAILIETGLSLLGQGLQPPIPSWGNMINDQYNYTVSEAVYIVVLPFVAIILLVQAFQILSRGLSDALDLKLETYTL